MHTSTALLVGGAFGARARCRHHARLATQRADQGRAPTVDRADRPAGCRRRPLGAPLVGAASSDPTTRCSRPARRRTCWASSAGRGSTSPELLEMVHLVRRDGQIREGELVLRRVRAVARPSTSPRGWRRSGSRLVLVLVEDRTRERRVEAIRRDFVANVSHELKTPVGALNLLAEAVGRGRRRPRGRDQVRLPDADRERAADPARPADHRAVAPAGRRSPRRRDWRLGRRDRRARHRPGPGGRRAASRSSWSSPASAAV